jgi:GT2 family glycosyltransferase
MVETAPCSGGNVPEPMSILSGLTSSSTHDTEMARDSGTPDISICVAVYKRHGEPNLGSLVASLPGALGQLKGELVVALNGITAADAAVPADSSRVAFEVNRGVPMAWNAAARLARAPVLCIVNDDVILGRDSLVLLHRALTRESTAGVVGPVGTRWDITHAQHLSYLGLEELPRGELRECEVVSGFLFATPKHVFDSIGGFEEAYTPCGYEEVDYCTAVRLRAGLNCFAVAGVEFTHKFSISAARSWRRVHYDGRSESIKSISRRNRRHFLAKWSAIDAGAVAVRHGASPDQ